MGATHGTGEVTVTVELFLDDCLVALPRLPKESIHLVFTSPPYYNARPEYAEYPSYGAYLRVMGKVFRECHRVLAEGRFIVVNVSPVIVPRTKRSESSTRIAIPFDYHRLLIRAGFEFIDDIIWVKPAGAGSGRNRGFFVGRQPLQYKPTSITENILVYRKRTSMLIDRTLRSYSDEIRNASRIHGEYEATNVWHINPDSTPHHPAVFPVELAEKVIRYYSFVGDTVLDPFVGSGTTLVACLKHNRSGIGVERNEKYYQSALRRIATEQIVNSQMSFEVTHDQMLS